MRAKRKNQWLRGFSSLRTVLVGGSFLLAIASSTAFAAAVPQALDARDVLASAQADAATGSQLSGDQGDSQSQGDSLRSEEGGGVSLSGAQKAPSADDSKEPDSQGAGDENTDDSDAAKSSEDEGTDDEQGSNTQSSSSSERSGASLPKFSVSDRGSSGSSSGGSAANSAASSATDNSSSQSSSGQGLSGSSGAGEGSGSEGAGSSSSGPSAEELAAAEEAARQERYQAAKDELYDELLAATDAMYILDGCVQKLPVVFDGDTMIGHAGWGMADQTSYEVSRAVSMCDDRLSRSHQVSEFPDVEAAFGEMVSCWQSLRAGAGCIQGFIGNYSACPRSSEGDEYVFTCCTGPLSSHLWWGTDHWVDVLKMDYLEDAKAVYTRVEESFSW